MEAWLTYVGMFIDKILLKTYLSRVLEQWHPDRSFHICHTEVLMPDPIPDDAVPDKPIVLPEDLDKAVLCLTINVTAGEGDTFNFVCTTNFGEVSPLIGDRSSPGVILQINVQDYFKRATVTPCLGVYEFSYGLDGPGMHSGPDGITEEEKDSLIGTLGLMINLEDYFGGYAKCLRRFPSPAVIQRVAEGVISELLTTTAHAVLKGERFVDPRSLQVIPVDCCACDFNWSPSSIMGVDFVFASHHEGGVPSLLIGYVSGCGSPIARHFNRALAQRMHTALVEATDRAVEKFAAKLEVTARATDFIASVLREDFVIDVAVVQNLADAVSARWGADMDSTETTDDSKCGDLENLDPEDSRRTEQYGAVDDGLRSPPPAR